MAVLEVGPGKYIGESAALALFKPVDDCIAKLFNVAGIKLLDFGVRVTAVYTPKAWPSRPRGFDFHCGDVEALIKEMEAQAAPPPLPKSADDFPSTKSTAKFNEDTANSIGGIISLGITAGRGWRQIGTGEVLHVELELSGRCNIHIDSHGYVAKPGEYDWGLNALLHGYWDLAPDMLLSPLYRRIGDRGQMGPMMFRPTVGLDGVVIWNVFGVTGYW